MPTTINLKEIHVILLFLCQKSDVGGSIAAVRECACGLFEFRRECDIIVIYKLLRRWINNHLILFFFGWVYILNRKHEYEKFIYVIFWFGFFFFLEENYMVRWTTIIFKIQKYLGNRKPTICSNISDHGGSHYRNFNSERCTVHIWKCIVFFFTAPTLWHRRVFSSYLAIFDESHQWICYEAAY